MTKRLSSLLLSLILTVASAGAGGPLTVTGPVAQSPGTAFVWDASTPIQYTVDGGPMSATQSGQIVVTDTLGLEQVQSMFQNWQSVSTTAISYAYAGKISGPGIPANGDIKTIQDYNAVMGICNSGSQNPLIFDADGTLLLALGLDPLVIGFSGTCKLDAKAGRIISAFVFMNGEFQDGVDNPQTNNYEITEIPETAWKIAGVNNKNGAGQT